MLPYNHSTAGNELKAIMGALEMEPFTIHDLRRTVGTQLLAAKNGLGVKKIDKLRVLNHAGELNGTVSDRVYDTNDYIPEKLAVLAPWGQLVATLVADQPSGAPQLKAVA
jgi:integrase